MKYKFDYGFTNSRNGVKVVVFEANMEKPEEIIFDFMFFASKQYEKCKINIFNKENMKISYKHEHLVPETPEEMFVFCRENDYTFGITYFCGVKNGFTTGFSIIKPHNAEAFICSTYEDESAIDIEKEISELTAAYNEWRQHVN